MTSASDAPSPKRSPRRRVAAFLGVALAGLIGGLSWFGRSDAFSDAVVTELGPLVKTLIGLEAVLGKVEVRPFQGLVRVDGVGLTHYAPADPTLHGAHALTVEAVEVDFGWRDFRPALHRLEIWRPALHLRVGPDGIRELAGIDIELDGQSTRLPWDELKVHEGTVVVEHPQWSASLVGLQISPAPGLRNDIQVRTLSFTKGDFRQEVRDLLVPRVLLAPGVVDIPQLQVRSEALDLSGHVALTKGDLAGHLDLEVQLEELSKLTQPQVRLEGFALLGVDLDGSTVDPKVRGTLETRSLLVERLRPDGIRVEFWIGDLDAELELQDAMLRASPIRAGWAGGQVLLHAGVDLNNLGVTLSGQARGLQLVDFLKNLSAAPTPWVSLDFDLDLDAAGTLRPLRLAGSVDAFARRLRVGSAPIEDPSTPVVLAVEEGRAFAQIALRDSTLDVDIHRFTASEGVEARVEIDAEFSTPPDVEIRTRLSRFPLHVLQPLGGSELQGIAKGRGRLWKVGDSFRAEADLDVQGMGVLGFRLADQVQGRLRSPDMKTLEFSELEALLGRTRYAGDIDVRLGEDPIGLGIDIVVHEGSLADLSGIVLEIPGLDADVKGFAKLSGPWNRTHGEISLGMSQVDLFGEPFDWGVARSKLVDGELFLDELSVVRDDDGSGIVSRGRIGRGYALDLDVHAGGVDLSESAIIRSAGIKLDGAVTADVHVGGSAFEPEPRGRLNVQGFTIGKRTLGAATLHFQTTGTQLSFAGRGFGDGVLVDGGLTLNRDADWMVDARLKDLDLAPLLPEPVDGGAYIAKVTGEVYAAGRYDTPAEARATLNEVLLSWGRHVLKAPRPWQLSASGRSFRIDDVALDGGSTQVLVEAHKETDGVIDFSSSGSLDVDLLRAVVPGLTRAAGTADFSVAANGLGETFVPEVDIDLRGGLFQGTWFPHAFEDVSGHIDASPAGFALSDTSGRLGGGRFTVDGSVSADGWLPTRIDLTSEVEDARVRYVDVLPPAVGDASLRFGGPMDALLLSGDIQIEDMVFADRIDWESWVLEFSGKHLSGAVDAGVEDYFKIDLSVKGDNTIRFRNNVGDFVVSTDLQFLGSTNRPGLGGRVRVTPGGRVLLKEREFEINRAELRFSDPYAFDPDVDIDMQTEISTREQDYDINYSVTGLYSDWRTTTRSEPGLPQADINALLLFGLTMEEMERYGGAVSALAVEGGDLLASKLGIVERVGQGVVGLDTFRPERIDLVSGVSERGSGSVSSDLRLLVEKDLDWATLIFEQNLSRSIDTYLGMERRLARLFYLRTYWAREQVGRRLDIGGAYGVEASIRGELD